MSNFFGVRLGLWGNLIVAGWLAGWLCPCLLLISVRRRRRVTQADILRLLGRNRHLLLYGNQRGRLKNSQVCPLAGLTEEAEELALDCPESDRQLGGGGQ